MAEQGQTTHTVAKVTPDEFASILLEPNEAIAQEFYDTDVTPRAKRERHLFSRMTSNLPRWNKYAKMYLGEENNNNTEPWKKYGSHRGFYAPWDHTIHLNIGTNDLDATLVHEQAHADQSRKGNPLLSRLFMAGYTFKPLNKLLTGTWTITPKDKTYLTNAYNAPESSVGSQLIEKHASNREMRFMIWKQLREELGRTPTLEETDTYIKQLTPEELKSFKTNSYQYDYWNDPDFNTFDVKNALIHVAQNSSSFQRQDGTYLAASGGTINYLNLFK